MVGSRFQSLGAAQLNDLSARVFLVLIVGKANKVAESSLRLKKVIPGDTSRVTNQQLCYSLLFYMTIVALK